MLHDHTGGTVGTNLLIGIQNGSGRVASLWLQNHCPLISFHNPPDDFASEPERWIEIIDRLYQDPGYINQCEKNRQNRTKLRYTSYHGTQSYAQKRHMRLPGHTNPIEGFKSSHWKEDTGWVNETASLDHEKILAEARRRERDVGDLSPNDQIEVMKNALGERRGHIKGVGHVVRKPTPEVSSGRQLTPREYWQQNVGNVIEENIAKRVEEQVQRNEQEFHRRVEEQVQRQVNQQLEQLQEQMRQQFNQQLEKIASTFKRKEQVINRQFRLLPGNRGDSGGRRDYRGDSSGSRDGSGDDEDDG